MSEDDVRNGGCLCGAVRFSVKGAPLRVGLCHCHDCRRTSGSAFNFFGVWPRSAYLGTGELSTFEGRSFCQICGSRVTSLRDDEAEIMLGALDLAPSDIVPGYELWIDRREPGSWMCNGLSSLNTIERPSHRSPSYLNSRIPDPAPA